VTLEALASGLAVVAFDAAAAGELIRDGRNGLLAARGDEDSFIDAACLAAGSSIDFAPLREQARRTALASDWEPVLQGFEQRLAQVACTAGPLPQASLA